MTTFINAQEMQKLHPETFQAPELSKLIEALEKSEVEYCKIATNQEGMNERFWVQVNSFESGVIKGIINNELILTHEHGLRCDDEVEFKPEEVYDWLTKGE